MANQSTLADTPISNKNQLIEFLEAGCCQREEWRIGTEHEKFVFNKSTLAPCSYEGTAGIKSLLVGMQEFGWKPVFEGANPISMQNMGIPHYGLRRQTNRIFLIH